MARPRMHKAIQALRFDEKDPAGAIILQNVSTPHPNSGELLLKMLCRPINPSDILAVQGLYHPWKPKSFPAGVGFEGMGTIEQIGEGVTGLTVGQRVFTLSPGSGTWQEYLVVPYTLAFPIPDSIPNEVAAQFFINPWTVYGLLEELNVPQGEYIIQTAAGSVLGRMFIQLAHDRGIKTINLVRRNEQKEELIALGADVVINFTEEDVITVVKNLTNGRMAYAAIECVGGKLTKTVISSVRDSGVVLVYGLLDGSSAEVGITDLIFRNVKLHGFHVKDWFGRLNPLELHSTSRAIWDLIERGVMVPMVGEKFELTRYHEAISKAMVNFLVIPYIKHVPLLFSLMKKKPGFDTCP